VEYYSSEIKSGLFIIISFIGLLIFLFLVGDFSKSMGDKKIIRVVTENSEHLEKHAPVSYAGFNVGEVSEIKLSNEREGYVELVLELNSDVNIKDDSTFSIKSNNIFGGKYVEIKPGSFSGKVVSSGDVIIAEKSFDLDRLLKGGDEILKHSSSVLKNVNNILSEKKTQESIPVALENVVSLLHKWNNMSDELKGLILSKDKIITRSLERIDGAVENLVYASNEVRSMVKNTNLLLVDARSVIGNLGKTVESNHPKVGETIDNIKEASKNMVGISEKLDLAVIETKQDVKNVMSETAKAVKVVSGNTDEVKDETVVLIRTAQESILENASNIFKSTENLKNTSKHLEAFSKKVRDRPHTLIWKEENEYREASSKYKMEKDMWKKGRIGFYQSSE